ncbi:MAG: dihydroorotate dehydrogenase electron transfer subunit [Planctomycetaceae bacterium]
MNSMNIPPHPVPLDGAVPTAVQTVAAVVDQERMARDTYRLRLRCPEIARQIVPGQFFMVRAPHRDDPLLGRPFALYDIYEEDGIPAGVDFGYLVVGKLTSLMAAWRPGDEVEVWGPLGNGFPVPNADHLIFVAGGIGQTPFLAAAREALGLRRYGDPPREPARKPDRVTMCYGVRSAEYLAGLADFDLPGLELNLATDDGTHGHHGFVTDLLSETLDAARSGIRKNSVAEGNGPPAGPVAIVCGPEPMMHAAAAICAERNVECWLSLETPMACGFGACFSCVTRVREEDGDWDYRRTCVEGPVFRADRLVM